MLTISHGICQFWQHLSRNFEKKFLLSAVIVSVNRQRKDIKLTFVSFYLHAGRFTVKCEEYENTLFSYFDFFIHISSNFTLDSRITKYLQCHIGLQFHTYFINFDLVKSRENCGKEFKLEPMFFRLIMLETM